jgi:tRNA threonylcarbamoyladenosine biosynthesis protein TsaE
MMAKVSSYYLKDDRATEQAGAAMAQSLLAVFKAGSVSAGAIIYLNGDLGAGKTTFSRGLIRALGHPGAVKSPTYTLVEPYELFEFPLYHFDLYRLSHHEEVEFLGVDDYFRPPSVCLIEWPDRGKGSLPAPDVRFELATKGEGRCMSCSGLTVKGDEIARKFSGLLTNH